MRISGVYQITNTVNGKRYIGSSVNIYGRWRQHKHLLRKNKHHSDHLQNSWNKYGEKSFKFSVMEKCDGSDLLIVEQKYLDADFPEYNTNKTAEGLTGYRHSEEAKKRMSVIHAGFRHTEESKKKMSEIWSGRPRGKYSEERRRKISESHKGKSINKNQKRALDEGRRQSPSKETREKISEAQKGYKPTPETIQKLKDAWVRRKARESANDQR